MTTKKKKLSRKEINHLANLAQLVLSKKEADKYQSQLGETLDYVRNLDEVDTKGVNSDFYTTDEVNVYFDDQVDRSRILTSSKALKNAKNKKGSFFVVSRIL